MWLKLAVVGLVLAVSSSNAENFALLVAGSNGWGNYRHQADVCHAYQVLLNRGFNKNNIITMMYDDIANNSENPLPGQIINRPDGPDVYKGVVIDYKGEELTPVNFLNVLSGNATAMKNIGSGRVLESGSEDIVFVNFVDHGGVGLICFPSDNLYADDLENTLRKMVKNQQFKKLLFYVEACESGSMFDNILEEHNNIFVSTAAAKDESSYAWYCSDPKVDTCLGDLYSISWLEHMDQILGTNEGNTESLWHQYDIVRTLVNESHVQLYGDFLMGSDPISLYLGQASTKSPQQVHAPNIMMEEFVEVSKGVASREVELHTAKTRLHRALPHQKQERLQALLQLQQNRAFADRTMSHIFKMLAKGKSKAYDAITQSKFSLNKKNYPCYKNLVVNFNQICFNTAKNNYLLRYLNKFVNVCNLKWISEAEAVQAMKISCSSKTRTMQNIV